MNNEDVRREVFSRYHREVKTHLPRNYFAHAMEGGLYMAGMEFVARDTILPPLMQKLGGPTWLVAISPILLFLGLSLPSVFLVHKLEALYWKKPIILVTGVFQRLPFLLAGLALIYWADAYPLLTMILVALAPFISGFSIGITHPAWMELVAKTIPAHRRASTFAVRMIIAAVGGIGASVFVKVILARYDNAFGFGLLYIACFVFLALSYIVFMMIKETNLPPENPGREQTVMDSLREIPAMLRGDRNLRNFVWCRIFMCGMVIAMPFLAIHMLDTLNKDADYLGVLLGFLVGGKVLGNIVLGYVGDRYGAKYGLLVCLILMAAVFPAAIGVHSAIFANLLFLFYGFAFSGRVVADSTMRFDLPPENRRTKYQSIMNLALLPGMLTAFVIGWLVKSRFPFAAVAVLSSLSLLISALFVLKIPEQRAGNS